MYKKYDISLKDEIESHVLKMNYKDHNLSFTNMFLWKEMYKLSVYVEDDFLIIFSELDGEVFSLNPICDIEYIGKAIEFLREYFKERGLPFIIHNCVLKVQEAIEEIYGDYFTYEQSRDSFDYLYSVDKMISYSGKKLQKKRNHVNNFLKNYKDRYVIKIIGEDEKVKEDCISFIKLWDENKKEGRDEYIDQEVSGAIDVIKHFDQLSCEGLAIYIDDELQAFGIGTQLNDTTAVVNIEKANADIVGLYPFVRQQLVKTFFDDLKYINTEDDVGDVNLRKSKLSYQPEYLVEKYTIRIKDEQVSENV